MRKIFIATGNLDKFKRISKWFAGQDVELIGPHTFTNDSELLINSIHLRADAQHEQ